MKLSSTIILLFPLLPSCSPSPPPSPPATTTGLAPSCQDDGGPPSDSGYLWLAADKDAHVACDRVAPGPLACETGFPGDNNFGTSSALEIMDRQNGQRRRSYVHFYLPGIPANASVIAAYANLFDNRPNTGSQDVRGITGVRSIDGWDPQTITWNNQPNPQTPQADFSLRSVPSDWTLAENMLPVVNIEAMMRGTEPDDGFMFHSQATAAGPFEATYVSDNAQTRTFGDMDNAPRLLLQVTPPLECSDLTMRPLPADTDLNPTSGTGPRILMVRTASGDSWPPTWAPGIVP